MQWRYFLIVAMTFLFSLSANASVVKNLYTGTVSVASQSSADRATALPQILQQVFVKVSGDSNVIDNNAIKQALANANLWMQEYHYVDQPTLALQASFDPAPINQLLNANHLSIWGSERPMLLVWLVNDNKIIGAQAANSDLPALLTQLSHQRGLPLLFPEMDLEDEQAVSAQDVTIFSLSTLQQAAKRYSVDGLLIGVIDHGQANWQLVLGNFNQAWQSQAATPEALLAAGVNHAVNFIASHHQQSSAQYAKFVITNVDSAQKFSALLTYLNQLTQLKNVEIKEVNGANVTLQAQINGGNDALKPIFDLSNSLQAQDDFLDPSTLRYRWTQGAE